MDQPIGRVRRVECVCTRLGEACRLHLHQPPRRSGSREDGRWAMGDGQEGGPSGRSRRQRKARGARAARSSSSSVFPSELACQCPALPCSMLDLDVSVPVPCPSTPRPPPTPSSPWPSPNRPSSPYRTLLFGAAASRCARPSRLSRRFTPPFCPLVFAQSHHLLTSSLLCSFRLRLFIAYSVPRLSILVRSSDRHKYLPTSTAPYAYALTSPKGATSRRLLGEDMSPGPGSIFQASNANAMYCK
ncbi:hypothetical protein GY45DRAFT_1035166 [Cubamyces sp. BRFM 1775]|nr:hypothetical protein GY45DRAFT_1035166 [Cubamyces sp. BRFM 1775]